MVQKLLPLPGLRGALLKALKKVGIHPTVCVKTSKQSRRKFFEHKQETRQVTKLLMRSDSSDEIKWNRIYNVTYIGDPC